MSIASDNGAWLCTPGNSSCNYDIGSDNFFKGKVKYANYGYNVTEWNAIVFVAAFGVMTLFHLGFGIWSRQWWTIYTLFCGSLGELIGWIGRLWSAMSTEWSPTRGGFWDSSSDAFLMQISVLIFSPAFLAAGNYILLGNIIPILGKEYTFIHPLSYTIIFIAGDIISLVVQAVGGGQASAADTLEGANRGGYVMVGGVMFQMIVMTAYTYVLLIFVYRWHIQKPFAHQIELFTWWPNSLRTSSFKRCKDNDLTLSRQSSHSPADQAAPILTDSSMPHVRKESGGTVTESDSTSLSEVTKEKQGEPVSDLPSKETVEPTTSNESSTHDGKLLVEKRDRRKSGFGELGPDWQATPREVKGAKVMLATCLVSTGLIFIRSVYRSIELLKGWTGPIVENQPLFNFLDGMLIAFSVAVFVVFHPGFWLPRKD